MNLISTSLSYSLLRVHWINWCTWLSHCCPPAMPFCYCTSGGCHEGGGIVTKPRVGILVFPSIRNALWRISWQPSRKLRNRRRQLSMHSSRKSPFISLALPSQIVLPVQRATLVVAYGSEMTVMRHFSPAMICPIRWNFRLVLIVMHTLLARVPPFHSVHQFPRRHADLNTMKSFLVYLT